MRRVAMMNRHQRGFNIIELLVVLAILSVILLVAIPIYQNYRIRAQVGEGINLAQSIRLAAAEYYMVNGAWPNNNEAADLKPAADYETHYITQIVLSTDGENASITITYKLPALGENNTIIVFSEIEHGNIIWSCKGGTVPDQYRPRTCRKSEG